MTTTAFNLDELKSHIGRTQTGSDVLHPGPANLLRLALARPEPEFKVGDPLPPAWLTLYFLPQYRPDELRPDGSPRDPHGPTPTSELALHLGVYADTSASAVVHVHAPWSTAVACVLDELPVVHYQQLLLGGTIRVAPFATFGTPALADAVRTALEGRSVALMANHGAVAHGSSLDQALERTLLLEWLCALHHRASALGPVRTLTEEQQHEVVLAALARNYGSGGQS